MDSEKKKKQLIVLFIIGSIIIIGIFIWSMILNLSDLSFSKPDIQIPEIPSNTEVNNQVEEIKNSVEENSKTNTDNSTEIDNP
jgi:hypothetical protein